MKTQGYVVYDDRNGIGKVFFGELKDVQDQVNEYFIDNDGECLYVCEVGKDIEFKRKIIVEFKTKNA